MSQNNDKIAIIVAGGNGSGKSKLINENILPIYQEMGVSYINADDWQKKTFGEFTDNPEHAKQAALWADKERQKHLDLGMSFIAETVFSHPSKLDLIKEAKDKGFFVTLYHVHLNSPEIAIERIANRVALGGHGIDAEKVRNRFSRLIPLVAEASKYADHTLVYDNSRFGKPHTLITLLERGQISEIYNEIPAWVSIGYDKQLKEHYNRQNDSSLTENQNYSNTGGNDMSLIKEKLGFEWSSNLFPDDIPSRHNQLVVHDYEKNMAKHVASSAKVSEIPVSIDQIRTLMKEHTVPNINVVDQDKALGLIEGSISLVDKLKNGNFKLNKETYLDFNNKVAFTESIESGIFRGEGRDTAFTPYVSIRHNVSHKPLKTEEDAPNLNKQFKEGMEVIQSLKNPMAKAMSTFLFGSLNQFTFEGEKRTAHLMMNGALMQAGLEPISIPTDKALTFQKEMSNFYETRNADKVMNFLIDCSPQQYVIRDLQKEQSMKKEITNEQNQSSGQDRSM